MRSSSICSGGRVRPPRQASALARRGLACLACIACLAFVACAGGTGSAVGDMADLANPFLGPDYSAWLIGPVSRVAKPDEIKAYLALRDDGQAAAFIEQFWERRNPNPGHANPLLAKFEERSEVADKKYSEAGLLGRRTDRGTIFVLYGPPAKGGFEVGKRPIDPPIEVWQYGSSSPAGLDGKRPDTFYRFIKRGELTVLYFPRPGTVPLTAAPP